MHLFLAAALITLISPVQAPEANRQPQLASGAGLTAVVFGSGNSIWFSGSHDDGRTFQPATEIARVPALALGRHRGPRVTIAGKVIVVSAVYGETLATGAHAHGLPANGDLVAWRSRDGGHTWSKPVTINDVPGSAREGLHSIAGGLGGELAAVWLDLRSPGTKLYGSYSKDGGATWSPNALIYESADGTICQCCDPSIVFSGAKRADVMFRNVSQGQRDMYLSHWNLAGQISKPEKLGNGSWQITACPMDGGGLAHRANTTVTAWRRDRTVYVDQPGQAERPVGEGKDVAVAISEKGPYVAWTGTSGIEIQGPGQEARSLCSGGNFPALTGLSRGGVLAAWEHDGSIQLRIID